MSEQNEEWKNVTKRKKKKRQYNKKQNLSTNNINICKKINKEPESILSKNNFPLLKNTKVSNDITCYSLVWGKQKNNSNIKNNNTIYAKAKNGLLILTSYPKFHNSPEPPLFQ